MAVKELLDYMYSLDNYEIIERTRYSRFYKKQRFAAIFENILRFYDINCLIPEYIQACIEYEDGIVKDGKITLISKYHNTCFVQYKSENIDFCVKVVQLQYSVFMRLLQYNSSDLSDCIKIGDYMFSIVIISGDVLIQLSNISGKISYYNDIEELLFKNPILNIYLGTNKKMCNLL